MALNEEQAVEMTKRLRRKSWEVRPNREEGIWLFNGALQQGILFPQEAPVAAIQAAISMAESFYKLGIQEGKDAAFKAVRLNIENALSAAENEDD